MIGRAHVDADRAFSELDHCLARLLIAASRIGCHGGDSKVGGVGVGSVELCQLVFGAGETDLQAFDLAEPALAFSFGDAGFEVVADLE